MSIREPRKSRKVLRLDAEQRAIKAWQARVAGLTWAQVAELVGFSDGTAANRAVSRYFGGLPQFDRDDYRQLWRDRLETLWRASARDVAEQRPGAVRSAVAVAQRAAALDGLDEPAELRLYTPGAEEFMRVVSEVRSNMVTRTPEADVFEIES